MALSPKTLSPLESLEKDALIKMLECPVCYTIPKPPIRMCERGHSVCSECHAKLLLCPQCQGSFTEARNFLAEQLLEQFTSKCTYHKSGCTTMVNVKDWDHHMNNCDYRPVDCNMKEERACIKVKMCFTNYVKHLKKIHKLSGVPSNCLNVIQHADHDRIGLDFPVPWESWPVHYLEAYERTFLTGTEIQIGKIFWWIYLVGIKEEAERFMAKITLTNRITNIELSWTGPVQSFRLSSNEVKDTGGCLLAIKSSFKPFTYLNVKHDGVDSRMSWNLSFTITEKCPGGPQSKLHASRDSLVGPGPTSRIN